MADYKCSFCGAEVKNQAYFDVDTGLVFCIPQQSDAAGEYRKIGTFSHAYQYMMQTGKSVFARKMETSEIEIILSYKKNK